MTEPKWWVVRGHNRRFRDGRSERVPPRIYTPDGRVATEDLTEDQARAIERQREKEER